MFFVNHSLLCCLEGGRTDTDARTLRDGKTQIVKIDFRRLISALFLKNQSYGKKIPRQV